jgi:cytoskeletal protein CcmA (bactofilin family)
MGTTLVHPEQVQAPILSGGSASTGSATIGRGVKIFGDISSKEDLYLNGEIEGTVIAVDHKLTIGPGATVRAGVKAREIVLLGTIQGDVEATERIEIRKDASLVGDIRTPRIVIEDGAYFKGSIDIVRAHGPRLAVLGSREAEAADARSEQDIRERRYITLDDANSLAHVLSEVGDESRRPQPATAVAPGRLPAPATWGLR